MVSQVSLTLLRKVAGLFPAPILFHTFFPKGSSIIGLLFKQKKFKKNKKEIHGSDKAHSEWLSTVTGPREVMATSVKKEDDSCEAGNCLGCSVQPAKSGCITPLIFIFWAGCKPIRGRSANLFEC